MAIEFQREGITFQRNGITYRVHTEVGEGRLADVVVQQDKPTEAPMEVSE